MKSEFTKLLLLSIYACLLTYLSACDSVPLSVSNITSCIGNSCVANIEIVMAINGAHGGSSCLEFDGNMDGSSGNTIGKLKIDTLHSVFDYRIKHLYDTGDPTVSYDSRCNCPGEGTEVPSSECKQLSDKCVELSRSGFHDANNVLFNGDPFTGFRNLLGGKCYLSGYADYKTNVAMRLPNNIRVMRSDPARLDLSLRAYEEVGNETRVGGVIRHREGEHSQLTLGDLTLSVVGAMNIPTKEIKGFLIYDKNSPHCLKRVDNINNQNVFNHLIPGFYQWQGKSLKFDEEEIKKGIQSHLLSADGCKVSMISKLPVFKSLLRKENDLAHTLGTDHYTFHDSNDVRINEAFFNRKVYDTNPNLLGVDHRIEEEGVHVSSASEELYFVHGSINITMQFMGIGQNGFFAIKDIAIYHVGVHDSYSFWECDPSKVGIPEISSSFFKKCNNNIDICYFNTTTPFGSKGVLHPDGSCREWTWNTVNHAFKMTSSPVPINHLQVFNSEEVKILLKVSGKIKNIKFQSDKICPEISSCHYFNGSIAIRSRSKCSSGNVLLTSSDSTVLHSRDLKLNNYFEYNNISVKYHDEKLEMKIGLCFREDCVYCKAFLDPMVENSTVSHMLKQIPGVNSIFNVLEHPAFNASWIAWIIGISIVFIVITILSGAIMTIFSLLYYYLLPVRLAVDILWKVSKVVMYDVPMMIFNQVFYSLEYFKSREQPYVRVPVYSGGARRVY